MNEHPNEAERRKLFNTASAARRAGVSARQLQIWDERGILRPVMHQHRRLYTVEQINFACRLGKISRAGIRLERSLKQFLTITSEAEHAAR